MKTAPFRSHRDVVASAARRAPRVGPAYFALAAQADKLDELTGRPRSFMRRHCPEALATCDACDWWTLADAAIPRPQQRIAS